MNRVLEKHFKMINKATIARNTNTEKVEQFQKEVDKQQRLNLYATKNQLKQLAAALGKREDVKKAENWLSQIDVSAQDGNTSKVKFARLEPTFRGNLHVRRQDEFRFLENAFTMLQILPATGLPGRFFVALSTDQVDCRVNNCPLHFFSSITCHPDWQDWQKRREDALIAVVQDNTPEKRAILDDINAENPYGSYGGLGQCVYPLYKPGQTIDGLDGTTGSWTNVLAIAIAAQQAFLTQNGSNVQGAKIQMSKEQALNSARIEILLGNQVQEDLTVTNYMKEVVEPIIPVPVPVIQPNTDLNMVTKDAKVKKHYSTAQIVSWVFAALAILALIVIIVTIVVVQINKNKQNKTKNQETGKDQQVKQ